MDNEQRLITLGVERTPDFCVTLSFSNEKRNPQRLLRGASVYIDALNSLDSVLVSAIDSQIKPVFVLEEIETGSIQFWLKQILEAINDNALERLDWKPAVGKYLVKAKYLLLKYMEGKTGLHDRMDLEILAEKISKSAYDTGAHKFLVHRTVSALSLAREAKKISGALNGLEEGDMISFQSDEGDSVLTTTFTVTQREITDLFAGESISNDVDRILTVKRPDFLGGAKWEFQYEKRRFSAKIRDKKWLSDFRAGSVNIRPGDALRAILRETVIYDSNGEVLKENREILEVTGIIKASMPGSLI
jgi:hypothetical protein